MHNGVITNVYAQLASKQGTWKACKTHPTKAMSDDRVGTSLKGKGTECGAVRIGTTDRLSARGGVMPVGTATYRGKERTRVGGKRPICATSFRQQSAQASCQPQPPLNSAPPPLLAKQGWSPSFAPQFMAPRALAEQFSSGYNGYNEVVVERSGLNRAHSPPPSVGWGSTVSW